jgi:DNA-binding response OmpR family regulator
MSEIFEDFMTRAGLKVIKFFKVDELIAFLNSERAEDLVDSVLLMDHFIPEIQEVAQEIKQMYPEMKIILMTNEIEKRIANFGRLFDGILLRPFTMREFLAQLDALSRITPSSGN